MSQYAALGVAEQLALERHCTQSPVDAQNWPAAQAELQTPASPAGVIDPPVDPPLDPVPDPDPPLVPLAAPEDPFEPPVVLMVPLPQAFAARPSAARRRPVESRMG